MINCPNCGAPITGDRCEYCGSVFDRLNSEINRLRDETRALKMQMDAEQINAAIISGVMSVNDIRKEIGFRGI